MSLSTRIVLILVAVVAGFLTLTLTVLDAVVLQTFEALEAELADSNLARVERAIDGEIANVTQLVVDWGPWDAAYDFVRGENPEFVAANVDVATQVNLAADVMYYYALDGRVMWTRTIDLHTGAELPADLLLAPLAPGDLLLERPYAGRQVAGLLATPSGPLVVSAYPVLPTNYDAEPAGVLIAGRLLDDTLMQRLRDATRVSFELTAGDAVTLEQDDTRLLRERRLTDIHGAMPFVLRVHTPRAITAVGLRSVTLALAFLATGSALYLGLMWLLMHRQIVRPLRGLTCHVEALRHSGDLSQRLGLFRRDEIGQLGSQFDALAAELERKTVARDEALEESRQKSRFLASMSHEIRTPMNGMLGMTELLLGTPLDERQRHLASTVRRCGSALLEIINDILDYSKIEAGRIEIEDVELDVQEIAEDVVALLSESARTKGIALRCVVSPGMRMRYFGDPGRLRQVLTNLVGNAVKFTERGEVRLSLRAEPRQAEQHTVHFEVSDTGIGITPEACSRIFESFAQADSSTTRRFGGTGLGLTICRQLVELMGGDIDVVSTPGAGSTFSVRIPLRECSQASEVDDREGAGAFARPSFAGLQVLIAEDTAVNAEIACAMLEQLGCTVHLARNGAEAVGLNAQGHQDVILMDCEMPVMDGYEATAQIRAREYREGISPGAAIVAMTANAMAGDREHCLAAGMDAYLAKPFSSAELQAAITSALQVAATSTEVSGAQQPLPPVAFASG